MRINKTILLSCLLLATACQGNTVSKTLGMEKSAPDEFMVISRPPLSVPPDFGLKAPSAEDEYKKESQIRNEAKDVVFPPKDKPKKGLSKGEVKLLEKAGNPTGEENIREILAQESIQKVEQEEEKGYFNSLFSTIRGEDNEPVIDAGKEKERINKNIDEDVPISEGEVPTTTPKKSGLLQNIF